MLKLLEYYTKRIYQKINPNFDFKIPYRNQSYIFVSNPPGSVLKFARNTDNYEDLKVICSLLKKGDTFFDVGANFGIYTLAVFDKLLHDVEIHCFEPENDAFRRLLQNKKLNTAKWKVNKLALGEKAGWTFITESLGGFNHIVSDSSRGDLVVMTTLDEYCRQSDVQNVDLMKVDVEGFELFVLKGAKDLFSRKIIKNLIFEVDDHEKRYNVDKKDYANFLKSYNYRIVKESSNYQLWSC